jgi:hypothetical protein
MFTGPPFDMACASVCQEVGKGPHLFRNRERYGGLNISFVEWSCKFLIRA